MQTDKPLLMISGIYKSFDQNDVVRPDDPNNDVDTDGVCGDVDNCPDDANAGQEDADTDTLGDACDACPDDPNNDADTDGVCEA